ncbi:hypothetical protein H696_02981 [Fonticula alba]|uniref:rRNA adenine N(6)-methyltransferase n=1 Tax=Fonticula alba TaxID=691883 RepID=A0A058Z8K1_FONAL|nr:hypothetical protein H696_02981 [Fonticula alba]KCV70624.1 hypothetical protein H696_02981 [Fonticula alba]|eukprot:XP_009495140.1 hypothetical protein H696_02981 [Fonticula alba]
MLRLLVTSCAASAARLPATHTIGSAVPAAIRASRPAMMRTLPTPVFAGPAALFATRQYSTAEPAPVDPPIFPAETPKTTKAAKTPKAPKAAKTPRAPRKTTKKSTKTSTATLAATGAATAVAVAVAEDDSESRENLMALLKTLGPELARADPATLSQQLALLLGSTEKAEAAMSSLNTALEANGGLAFDPEAAATGVALHAEETRTKAQAGRTRNASLANLSDTSSIIQAIISRESTRASGAFAGRSKRVLRSVLHLFDVNVDQLEAGEMAMVSQTGTDSNNIVLSDDSTASRGLQHLRQFLAYRAYVMAIHMATSPGTEYLCCPLRAQQVVSFMGDIRGATVVEIAPGPGVLSEALLVAGAEKVYGVEEEQLFAEDLRLMQVATEGRFEPAIISPKNLMSGSLLDDVLLTRIQARVAPVPWSEGLQYPHLVTGPEAEAARLAEAAGVTPEPGTPGAPLGKAEFTTMHERVPSVTPPGRRPGLIFTGSIGSRHHEHLLSNMMQNIFWRSLYFELGRVESYFLLPAAALQRITYQIGHRSRSKMSCMMETLFHLDHLMSMPQDFFLPSKASVNMELIRLIPRADVPTDLNIIEYEFILRQLFVKRSYPILLSIATLGPGAEALLEQCPLIDPTLPPTHISIEAFFQLTRAFANWPHKPLLHELTAIEAPAK